jgi:hypothetical protein
VENGQAARTFGVESEDSDESGIENKDKNKSEDQGDKDNAAA